MASDIFKRFEITTEDYKLLEKKFDSLCKFVAWRLKQSNARNNCTDDLDDFIQEMRLAVLYAGAYYKRQTYIEECLILLKKHLDDNFLKLILEELVSRWRSRSKSGDERKRFDVYHEEILENLVKENIPDKIRPSRQRPLIIDQRFPIYCKNIIWNKKKAVGRKITKERAIRGAMVSLGQYEYIGSMTEEEC
jgi:hypothetical protein